MPKRLIQIELLFNKFLVAFLLRKVLFLKKPIKLIVEGFLDQESLSASCRSALL
jgi:hypothetical protein